MKPLTHFSFSAVTKQPCHNMKCCIYWYKDFYPRQPAFIFDQIWLEVDISHLQFTSSFFKDKAMPFLQQILLTPTYNPTVFPWVMGGPLQRPN